MNKKLILISSAIIVFILVAVYGYYTFMLPSKEIKEAANITVAPKEEKYEFFGSFLNGVSLLECSKDKNRIYTLCEAGFDDPNKCASGIITVYLGYLYKTKQADDHSYVIDIISEKVRLGGNPISRDYAINFVHDFLATDKVREDFTDDFKIWKTVNEDEIIKKHENDINQFTYFQNILEYKKATKLDDCRKITLPLGERIEGTNRNYYNNLVRDACQLTFVSDKEAYCRALNESY